jgi:hypothetical protein
MRKNYRSFLLRLWRVQVDGKFVWRASLENPFTGERKGFANLSQLVVHLESQVSDIADDGDETTEP